MNRMLNKTSNNNNNNNNNQNRNNHIDSETSSIEQNPETYETKDTSNNIVERSRLMAITDMNTGLGVGDGDINHHHRQHNDQNGVGRGHDDDVDVDVDAVATSSPLSVINDDNDDDKIQQDKSIDDIDAARTVLDSIALDDNKNNRTDTINSTIKQQKPITSSRRFDTIMDGHTQKRYSTESTDSSSIIQRLLDKIENLEYELKVIKQERDSLYSENERLCFQLQMINEADKHQQRSKRPQSASIAPVAVNNTLILNQQYPSTKSMAGGDSFNGNENVIGVGIECSCNQYQPQPPLSSSSTTAASSYHRAGTATTPLLYNIQHHSTTSCLPGQAGVVPLVSQQQQAQSASATVRTMSNNHKASHNSSSSSSSFSTQMDGDAGGALAGPDDPVHCGQCAAAANHMIGHHHLTRSQSSHSSFGHRNSLNMSIKLSPTISSSGGAGFFDGPSDMMAGGCPPAMVHQHHHGLPSMQSGSNLVRTSRTTGGSTTSLASNSNSVPYNYEISQQLLDKKVSALERKYGGIAAREAAIKIQRSYRSYRLTKRFRLFVSHAAKQKQMLKQQQTTTGSFRMMRCPKNECHHHTTPQMDELDQNDFDGYGQQSSYHHHQQQQQQQQQYHQPRQLVNQIHNYHHPHSVVTTQPTQQTMMMMMMSGMNITDGNGYESGMMYSQRAPASIYAHPNASPMLNDLDGGGGPYHHHHGSNSSLAGTGIGGGGGKRLQKKTSFSSTSSTGSSSSLHAVVPATAATTTKQMSKELDLKTDPSTVSTDQIVGGMRNQNLDCKKQWQSQQLSSQSLSANNNAAASSSSSSAMQQPQQQQNQINKFRITKQYSQSQSSVNNNNNNNNNSNSSNIIRYNHNATNNANNNNNNNNDNSDHYAATVATVGINPIITTTATTSQSIVMMNHNQQPPQQQNYHHHHCNPIPNTTVSTGSGTIIYQHHPSGVSSSMSSNVTTTESSPSASMMQQMNNNSIGGNNGISGSMAGVATAAAAGSNITTTTTAGSSSSSSSDAHRKRLYRVGLNLFNKQPSERGIRFLIQHNFIEPFTTMDEQAKSVAIFLLTRKGVSRQMIGEYLADLQPFNKAVLKAFVTEINLQGLIVDEALRSFQINFRFPGEAQKIERLVEAFADRYKECNPDDVLSRDSIFILAFAIIMLNTDLHKPTNMKHRMTPEQWLANLKGVFSEGDLSAQFLLNIYKRIKKQELQTGPDHTTQVMKVQSTMVGKDVPNLCVPHRRLVCYCRLYEIRDVNRKEKVGQHQRDVFLFNDLLLITKTTNRSRNQLAEYQYRSSTSLDGLHVNTFSKGFYAHGIRISRRVDQKVLALFNARNELDQKRFVEDLRESILEMDEMEQIRITKSSSLVQLNNFTIGTDFSMGNGVAGTDVVGVGLQRQLSKNSTTIAGTNYVQIHGNVHADENTVINKNPNVSYNNNNNNNQSSSSSSLSSNVPQPATTAAQNPPNGHIGQQHHPHHPHYQHHHYSSSNMEQPPATTTTSSSTSSTMQ